MLCIAHEAPQKKEENETFITLWGRRCDPYNFAALLLFCSCCLVRWTPGAGEKGKEKGAPLVICQSVQSFLVRKLLASQKN